jgi:hypothetical protein
VNSNSASCSQNVIVILTDADADSDGDGISDLTECLSGTDPLDSQSALRMLDIKTIGNDIRLTWLTVGNSTNVIQTVAPIVGGNYTNSYIDVGTVFVPGTGLVTTNYLDGGGATNNPSRYYRIGLQPGPPCSP